MLSKFSLINIIQSLNSPVHSFRTLKNVIFNDTDGENNYTTRETYIFIVRNNDTKQYLKFYKDYSLDKVKTDYNTIQLASEMGDAPFSKAEWLKDEFYFMYGGKAEYSDIACYSDDSTESFENFLYTTKDDSKLNINIQKFNSFLSTLKWLLNSNYIIDKLSLDSFYIDKNLEVKINIFDVNIYKEYTAKEKSEFNSNIANILNHAFHSILQKGDNPNILSYITQLNEPNCDLLNLINTLNSENFLCFNDILSSDNCFNNPKYTLGNNRSENRIIIIDNKTKLKGFCNYDGILVTKCIYDELINFTEGYCVAILGGKSGVIDKNNKVIVDFVWDWLEYEHMYNLFIAIKDDIRVVLNRKGEQISDKSFKFIESFVDGYAIVNDINGKTGVINQNCNYVIEPNYDKITYCYLNEFELTQGDTKERICL